MKPQSREAMQQELDALGVETEELERTIAVAKERLIVIGRRVRSLMYAGAPIPNADEATIDAIQRQQLASHDPGEPTTDDWVHWIDEGTAAFRSLAQDRDGKPSAPPSQGEVKWLI
jgi:hypothetical protein